MPPMYSATCLSATLVIPFIPVDQRSESAVSARPP